MFKGGDIGKNKAFKYILSIGYELETSNLIKLTEMDYVTDEQEKVFTNSDTSRKDIDFILSIDNDPDEIEDYLNRQTEIVDIKINENVKFYITNDLAHTLFVKKLQKICTSIPNPGAQDDYSIQKNNMYKYIKNNGEQYAINFINWNEANSKCFIFSVVEWVATFFKPNKSSNVILDTFTDTIKIILHHLNSLQMIEGDLIMKTDTEDKYIGKPGENYLYNLPDTNLYYLKTTKGSIDDITITVQMTFSAHISNIFFVMLELLTDRLQSYDCVTITCKKRINQLIKIQECVNKLIINYNKTHAEYKIHTKTVETARQIKNYIGLILYKLFIYYNYYKGTGFLKSALAMNVRHSNYELYIELKQCLQNLFEEKLSDKSELEIDEIIINIINQIIIQPDILVEYLLENKKNAHKNAFNIDNILDVRDKRYGDPKYSLATYFRYFEHPIDEEISRDWLEYSEIDYLSARMDIVDNVILIEYRNFPRMLHSYVYSTLNSKQKGNLSDNVGVITIKNLVDFVRNYDMINNTSPSKTVESLDFSTIGMRSTSRSTRRRKLNSHSTTKKK